MPEPLDLNPKGPKPRTWGGGGGGGPAAANELPLRTEQSSPVSSKLRESQTPNTLV